ncbi:UDP-N-acetylmuramoyl-L-alanyl-D-glutamate--2,6-diaminopimelate ligase [Bacteroidetes/Chlorobi group bacterium ChocPot_Mid]|nr:MAG: UDP-N-acetylmuramoyl-L-alanyl-D-glutamate--2,6-diaminopimelate ligase [Bacteroidetes/Chlorobi group bacterium ChocPot_Mid]
MFVNVLIVCEMRMKLSDVIGGIECKVVSGGMNKQIEGIAYDSRKCNRGSVFVAIKGSKTDGHSYIKKLIDNGISSFICEDVPEFIPNLPELTVIQVDNSRKALAVMSKNWYNNPLNNIKVIGVTGTNGKTTITYLLKAIFEKQNFKTGVVGTTGIFCGDEFEEATHTTPESLELFGHFDKMRNYGVEFVFMEVSSHALQQNRVASIDFDCAVFTNLTHEHLDYHRTMDEYARAKKMLFNMLSENGKAIVNGDDDYADFMLDGIQPKQKIKFGRKSFNNVRIINESLNYNTTKFSIDFDGRTEYYSTPMLGRFNIDNCVSAIVCAKLYGISNDIIQSAISEATGAPGRMQRIKLKNGAIGIVDYSHTPDSLEKALLTCREMIDIAKNDSKLICVFGCGGDRDKTKRPLMGKISSTIADLTIVTDDNPRNENSRDIIDDILKGIDEERLSYVEVIANRKEAIKYAVEKSKESDLILVAGKGHENYQIYGNEKSHFDDAEELKEFS